MRPITDQNHENVVVKVHEGKRNSIVYGFGFQVVNRGGSVPSGTVVVPGIPPVGLPPNFKTSEKTFWGPDGTFEYTRRNLRGRAESFTISAFAGRLDQQGSLSYTDPSFRGSSWKSSAILSAEHDSQNPIFTARIGNLGYQLEKALNAKKTTHLFLRYNFQLTRISNLLIPDLVPPDQLNVHLSTLSANWIHDTRDNVLDAHRGIYQTYQLSVNPAWLGSNFSFASFRRTNRLLQEHRQRDHLGKQHSCGPGAGLCRKRSAAEPAFLFRRRQHLARLSTQRRRPAARSRSL